MKKYHSENEDTKIRCIVCGLYQTMEKCESCKLKIRYEIEYNKSQNKIVESHYYNDIYFDTLYEIYMYMNERCKRCYQFKDKSEFKNCANCRSKIYGKFRNKKIKI